MCLPNDCKKITLQELVFVDFKSQKSCIVQPVKARVGEDQAFLIFLFLADFFHPVIGKTVFYLRYKF